jgi:hypothetical protein
VYFAANVMHPVTPVEPAATSVPSETRTQRKALAACWIAVATWVPMSYLRLIGRPEAADVARHVTNDDRLIDRTPCSRPNDADDVARQTID